METVYRHGNQRGLERLMIVTEGLVTFQGEVEFGTDERGVTETTKEIDAT